MAALCLTVLCLMEVGASTAAARSRIKSAAKHAAAATQPALAGRIAFVGEGANIYVCGAACAKPTCITCAARQENARAEAVLPVALTAAIAPPVQYGLPTFSPDGNQIAYSSVQRERGGSTSFGINAYDFNRRAATAIFQSPDRPIYFFWLPDGKRLFFLASDGESLKLILAQSRESQPVRILLTGLPLFFDWKQASSDLAFHYAPAEEAGPEQTGLMDVTDHDQRVVDALSKGKALFRSPAWSPDGSHLAYVVDNKNGQMALMVANAEGSGGKPMVGLAPLDTAFLWAPDSVHIAFSTLKQEGKMSYDGINLLDINSGNISPLVSDPVIAYNFSPDGKWLAYIGVSETSNTWNVIAAGGGHPRRLCSFVTTSVESMTYQVFDQYALSHRFWSPDSRALVFAGVMLKEGEAARTAVPPSVWVLPMDGEQPWSVGDGSLAFWSPR